MSGAHAYVSSGKIKRQGNTAKIIKTCEQWLEAYGSAPCSMMSREFIDSLRKKLDKKEEKAAGQYSALPGLQKITPHTRFRFEEAINLPVINPSTAALATASDPAAMILHGTGVAMSTAAVGAGTEAVETVAASSTQATLSGLPSYAGWVQEMHKSAQKYSKIIQVKSFPDYFSWLPGVTDSDSELKQPSDTPEFSSHREIMASAPVAMIKAILMSGLPQESKIQAIDGVIRVMHAWANDKDLMWPDTTFNRKIEGVHPALLGAYIEAETKNLFLNYTKILDQIKQALSAKPFVDLSLYTNRVSNQMKEVYESGLSYLYRLLYLHRVPEGLLSLCQTLQRKITKLDWEDAVLLQKLLEANEDGALDDLMPVLLPGDFHELFRRAEDKTTFLASHGETVSLLAARFREFYQIFTAQDILSRYDEVARYEQDHAFAIEDSPDPKNIQNAVKYLNDVGQEKLSETLDFKATDLLKAPLRFALTDCESEADAKSEFVRELKALVKLLRRFLLLYLATREDAEFTQIFNAASVFINRHLKETHYDLLLEIITGIQKILKSFETRLSSMKDCAMNALRHSSSLSRVPAAGTLPLEHLLRLSRNLIEALDGRFPAGFDILISDIKLIKTATSIQEMSRLAGISHNTTVMNRRMLACAVGRTLALPLSLSNQGILKDAAVFLARRALADQQVQKSLNEYSLLTGSLLWASPKERAERFGAYQAAEEMRKSEPRSLVPPGYVDVPGLMSFQFGLAAMLRNIGISAPEDIRCCLQSSFENISRIIQARNLKPLPAASSCEGSGYPAASTSLPFSLGMGALGDLDDLGDSEGDEVTSGGYL